MLNKDLNRLEMILDSISKIEGYTNKFEGPDSFNTDVKSFDATMMNFVVIGEMVLKLSDEFKNMHPGINWIKIKAFRNIVAHDYFGVDAEEVWQIIKKDLPDLKENISSILKVK
ncbi:MAG TPA: hypothetical protein DCM62_07075 [Bacteroidales bacterium]|nr:hypothetical protein [Bacteroidales bacterium]